MKEFICLAVFSLVISITAHADEKISDSQKALISTLLEQTGQAPSEVGTQFASMFIQQMTMVLKQSKPELDQRAFDIMEEEVNALIQEEVVVDDAFNKMMYPIYAKHFSESELEEMIELNKTVLGQKIIKVMPALAQEAMQAGQQFGESLAPRIQERIEARFETEGMK